MNENTKDSGWLENFDRIFQQADAVIDEVTLAVNSEDEAATRAALNKAVTVMTPLLAELKDTPKPAGKDLKEVKKRFADGYKVFLDGCNYGVEYLCTPSPWNRSVWWITLEKATDKLHEAVACYKFCRPGTEADTVAEEEPSAEIQD
ncbi:MAG: hypothetical protein P3T54_05090 [Dehalogenimonas sp.]|uniref:Uncharacterized protein n=1 Tax=Candidatus Dehalogenimonas loeffleri TaxID=3127115 RepID=A0ABZ2J2E7_9CHLR|nr:hypothetical protein [Dehalogenimonas sp.]